MKLPHDTIVLVADGARMLLLFNHGDEVYPDLRVIEHREYENPPNRELRTDSPGVAFSGGYSGRSAMDEGDPHQQNESRFLAAAAERLTQAAAERPGGIVVAAPPRALGELRRCYDRAVSAKLIAEIDKDFTRHPVEELTRLLTAQ